MHSRSWEGRRDVPADRVAPFGCVVRRVPAQHERRGRLLSGRVQHEAAAAPAGGDRRGVRNAECLEEGSDVEFSERLGRRESGVADPTRKTDGKRRLALEELVDVQQLLRRLRKRAQRCCERGSSAEVAQLGGECAARPETGGHL